MNRGPKNRPRLIELTLLVAMFTAVVIGFHEGNVDAAAARPPLPNSVASLGDSITRAMDACCGIGDIPEYSWSTGASPRQGLQSHYQRILAENPIMSRNRFNDAATGAVVADTPAQAARAVAQRTEYVTILVGANDVCSRTPATMTSTQAFAASFTTTMNMLERGLPRGAHIFVGSIPNVYNLRRVKLADPVARAVWRVIGVCPSMLSERNTDADRARVLAQVKADNAVLAAGCKRYPNCRWDGGAVFNTAFKAAEVSVIDSFHPSIMGQGTLANVTWNASWWPQVRAQQGSGVQRQRLTVDPSALTSAGRSLRTRGSQGAPRDVEISPGDTPPDTSATPRSEPRGP